MKKNKDILNQLEDGALTEKMDFNSKEYADFKLLIRGKVSSTPIE